MGTGTAEALSGQVDRYYQGMGNIVALGQGQAGNTMSGLGDLGNIANQRAASEAQGNLTGYLANQQFLGTAVGSGIGLYMAGGGPNKGTTT